MLLVSSQAPAARGLYRKLGYSDVCDYGDVSFYEVRPGGRVVPVYAEGIVAMRKAELKGSVDEGPNQTNYSDRSSVRILAKFSPNKIQEF